MTVKLYATSAASIACLVAVIVIVPVLPWTQLRQFQAMIVPPPVASNVRIPATGRPPLATRRPNFDIRIVAHRGAAMVAPENTLPALEAAIELGAHFVEIDVRFTADGHAVLLHDARVNRTTNGSGRIAQLRLDEVRQLDAGSWFGQEFAGTRIPTLEAALATLQGRACILWDTKAPPNAESVALFQRYGFDDDCLLITDNGFGIVGTEAKAAVDALLQLWPEAPLLIRVRNVAELALTLEEYPHMRGIFVPLNAVDDKLIDSAHAAGLLVLAKALDQSDNESFYGRITAAGFSAILSNRTQELHVYLKAAQSKPGNFPESRDNR